MKTPYALADYARAVMADLSAVMVAIGREVSVCEAQVAQQRFASLHRTEQIAMYDLFGRPGAAASWSAPMQAALKAAVQAELAPAPPAKVERPGGSGVAPALLSLSLMDELEVEEEIELARLIERLETAAEAELRDLRLLAAALRGEATARQESPLLHPQACAAALGQAARHMPVRGRARVASLRFLGDCMVTPLREAYKRHLLALKTAGVQPAQLLVRLGNDAAGAAAAQALVAFHAGRGGHGERVAGALSLVMAQAQGQTPGPVQAQADDAFNGEGRAGQGRAGHSRAGPSTGGPPVDPWMPQLLRTMGQDTRASVPMQQLFHDLAVPAQRLATREPGVWQEQQHPWWRLLDGLMGLCDVLEAEPGAEGAAGSGKRAVATHCQPIVARFAAAAEPNAHLCLQLLDEVNHLMRALAPTDAGRGPPPRDTGAEDTAASELPTPAASPKLPAVLRDQMAQQLRSSLAPASLRRFLLGPWVQALAGALEGPSADEHRAELYSGWVDQLLGVLSPSAENHPVDVPSLLEVARDGLERLGLDESQVQSWLFDLTLQLADAGSTSAAYASAGSDTQHDELPTVPVDLQHGAVQGRRARRDREAWLDSLRVGDVCRLFLEAQWHTLQLMSLDEDTHVFVFQGRDAAEHYHCTRRALERLRGEGLATTLELSTVIVPALDTMAGRLEDLRAMRSPR